MPNIFFLVLRRMRAPLITLILIYAISVLGLVLIPGVDSNGQPYRMDFFHAFYFISYTATTIGFGEVPYAFTYLQRMWVVVCIYLSVIGWAFGLGTLFAILQDKRFQQAVQLARFARKVRHITEPFFLICGYGQTGRLLGRQLEQRGLRFVVLENREERVNEVMFADYVFDVPAYAGDAASPEMLQLAGILHPQCRGVLALTGDEQVNLAIAISAYVLRPALVSVCRAKTHAVAENMASFGTNRIVNMFDAVGQRFRMALHAPQTSRLWSVLSAFQGEPLPPLVRPPRGHWVVVGYGRFGHAIRAALDAEGSTVTVIDLAPPDDLPRESCVVGLGVDAATLKSAGLERAVGIVACIDHDANNLSAIATARQLKPELFVVARQNLAMNHVLFDAFRADVTVVRSEVVAQECLRAMTTPTLARFMELIQLRSEVWAAALLREIDSLCAGTVPDNWVVELNSAHQGAMYALMMAPQPPLTLRHLLLDPHAPERQLACMPLLLIQSEQEILLPPPETALHFGDRLLFVGQPSARRDQQATVNQYRLIDYVRTGIEPPAGWLFRKLAERRQRHAEARVVAEEELGGLH
ncbi:potassium channel family protein [Chitinimonas taiwanensis]|uniref:Trk K+ transport system, NAD-binding component n=1 Tax=Chitinimonas taiwanensis DSM 18899 TaxID=1121279 RepID=A0A1K2H4R8_9NEIS|nr:NAD-binding protein [Chitinimonas taiwanensis]SFZ70137.1 Trk K+ transport system, NAD-binding component [Chitinimonas taiwanensis DSM 18899]